MSDLISRDALIDAHYDYCNKHHDETAVFYGWSQRLMREAPSAQPEPCEDAVSREDVLNEMYDSIKKCERALASNVFNEKERFGIECEMESLRYSLDVFENLPSVHTERKKGKWELLSIMHSMPPTYVYRCSECGMETFGTHDFCPNCGADMRTPVDTARDIIHEAIDNSVWSDTVDTAKMHKVVDDKYAEMETDNGM